MRRACPGCPECALRPEYLCVSLCIYLSIKYGLLSTEESPLKFSSSSLVDLFAHFSILGTHSTDMAACVATSRIHAPVVTRRAAQLRTSSFVPSLATPRTTQATPPPSPLLRLVVRAGWNDVAFAPAKITSNKVVTSSPVLNRLLVDVGGAQAAKYSIAGQFVQVKTEEDGKAGFFAIASAPDANNAGVLELLVKASGDPAEAICASADGTGVLVSDVMGKGFPVDRVAGVGNVFIFCTGSGISPIKALIEVRRG